MGRIDMPSAVSDAGPIIHLAELDCVDLLQDFREVLVPRVVWTEVLRHRPELTTADIPGGAILDVRQAAAPRLLALARSLGLHTGETAALALMQGHPDHLFLSDDGAARLAAESLGFTPHGTIGIIVRSIRRSTRTRQEVLSLLREVLHLTAKLLAAIVARVEQESVE